MGGSKLLNLKRALYRMLYSYSFCDSRMKKKNLLSKPCEKKNRFQSTEINCFFLPLKINYLTFNQVKTYLLINVNIKLQTQCTLLSTLADSSCKNV